MNKTYIFILSLFLLIFVSSAYVFYSTRNVEAIPIALPDECTTTIVDFTFDDGCGSLVRDKSEFGNHGKIINASWTTDSKSGYALEFYTPGTGHVDIQADTTLTTPKEVSLELWIKRSHNNYVENETILQKLNEINVLILTDNRVDVRVNFGSLWTDIISTSTLNQNIWYKIKIVRDENNDVQLYINDILEAHTNPYPPYSVFSYLGSTIRIGMFRGIIDDFKMTGY